MSRLIGHIESVYPSQHFLYHLLMCGRFELHSPIDRIINTFHVKKPSIDYRPRYNIAPTQNILIVTSDGHDNHLITAKWGLIPHWAKDSKVASHMINARAETLSEKPSFKGLLKSHRCIVIADGFYEWKHEGKIKRPMYITLKDRHPFGFAGLYSHMEGSGW